MKAIRQKQDTPVALAGLDRRLLPTLAASALTLGVAGQASAELRTYVDNDPSEFIPAFSEIDLDSLTTTYDTVTREFTWSATFSPSTDPTVPDSRSLPTGFVLVVNDGPEPRKHVGELAAIYFDAATDPNDPIISAYAYNGATSATSYREGIGANVRPNTVGNQPPDRIVSELDPSSPQFVNSAALTDNPDGTRTLSMSLDASVIQNHVPLYNSYDYESNTALSWYGLGFGEEVGIWFHPYIAAANYDASGYLVPRLDGRDSGWNEARTDVGYYDVFGQPTVPEPATLAMLLGLGGLALARRRA